MINERFHFLLVVEELEPTRYARTFVRNYRCLCDCGAETFASGPNLKRGATKSCGCWKQMTAGFGTKSHGMSKTDEYKIWAGIKKRCLNPKYKEFHLYGGRGITISARWAESFENFYADMGPRPSKSHSIDRKDNDGNYEPGNCRWATDVEQSHNSKQVRLVQYEGQLIPIRDLARKINRSYWTVYKLIARRGMPVEDALLALVSSEAAEFDPSPRRSPDNA